MGRSSNPEPATVTPQVPTTVNHGDLRADNVMARRSATGVLLQCIALDLQCMKSGPGEFDLAYLLRCGHRY